MRHNLIAEIYRHPLLTSKNLEELKSAHKVVSFEKGHFLLRENEVANCYYLLESGVVRSFVYDVDNNDITTHFFCKNELIINASSLFQRIPAQENIQTLTKCLCWEINFEDFQRLFHSMEGFREWGRSWMAESLFGLKKRSIAMITDSATDRYLELLKSQPDILKNAPLKHIASYLGITDSSLSRIRKEAPKV